jgi:NADPH-dependent ferric siderophore reductase
VVAAEDRSPRLRRVTIAGPELDGFAVELPAASVRLLLPEPGAGLVVPEWNGNEFLLPDGRRPVIRTLTPWDLGDGHLAVDVVLHGSGRASTWARAATAGDSVGVSGPGRGYAVDPDAPEYVVAGDETAIPAIEQVLAALPRGASVQVHVEVADAAARLAIAAGAAVDWHVLADGAEPGAAMLAAVRGATFGADARVWAAGEAAAVQRVRTHLFEERGLTRAQCTVRGYWKHGRAGGDAAGD